MRFHLERLGEHVGASLRSGPKPSETATTSTRNNEARWLLCSRRDIARDSLGETAGSENQDIARISHVIFFSPAVGLNASILAFFGSI
jgi:hypothetical protein